MQGHTTQEPKAKGACPIQWVPTIQGVNDTVPNIDKQTQHPSVSYAHTTFEWDQG